MDADRRTGAVFAQVSFGSVAGTIHGIPMQLFAMAVLRPGPDGRMRATIHAEGREIDLALEPEEAKTVTGYQRALDALEDRRKGR